MRNYIQSGDRVALVAPYAVASGAGLLVGSVFAVATGPAASGATIECQTEGVFDLPKAAGAVTQGALLYWDNTNKVVTTTATSNTKIGWAVQAAASGDATARVNVTGQV